MRAVTWIALLALAACEGAPTNTATSSSPVTVENAYVQLPVATGRPAVAYFRLEAADSRARLVSVASSRFERIELHGSMTMAGMSSMAPLAPQELGFDKGALTFAPGGKHAMVFGVPQNLRSGAHVPLTFSFADGTKITAQAEVRALGSAGE